MAEINSRQKTAIAAGTKVLHSAQGTPQCLYFNSPATAAWALNDTFASGMRIPKGSRILPTSYLSHGAMGVGVTADVGLRNFVTGAEIDLDGIAANLDVAAAGRTSANNGALVITGVDSVTTADAEVVITLKGADPTDGIQMSAFIFYLPPG